jgi:proteasome accessory factor B
MELGTPQQGGVMAEHLEQLWAAAASRKWVQLAYFSPRAGGVSDRKVDPYGLALRRGTWSLVGFCHLRQGIRTFHVHRIRELKVNPSKPKSPDFEVPQGFKLDDYVAAHPWQHRFHEPLVVTIALRGELSRLAGRLFPGGQVEVAGDEARVKVKATYLDGLVRHALSMGHECKVLEPPQAHERWRQMAERVLAQHGGEVPAAPASPEASGGGES